MERRPVATINVSISKQEQDLTFTELATIGHSKVRIYIRSNSYKMQCQAHIERWDGNAWREVWTLQSGAMQTKDGLYVARDAKATEFKADRDTLVQRAIEVLL